MLEKSHIPDWIVFFIAALSLYLIYELDIKKLLEVLLQWTFAVAGFKLLIDYGLIKNILTEERLNNIPLVSKITTKKFKYGRKI